jgi:hypothetical protein
MLNGEWREVETLLNRSKHNVSIVAKPFGGQSQSMTVLCTHGQHHFLIIPETRWDGIGFIDISSFKVVKLKAREENVSVEAQPAGKTRGKAACSPTHAIRNDIALKCQQHILLLVVFSAVPSRTVGVRGIAQERRPPNLSFVLFL